MTTMTMMTMTMMITNDMSTNARFVIPSIYLYNEGYISLAFFSSSSFCKNTVLKLRSLLTSLPLWCDRVHYSLHTQRDKYIIQAHSTAGRTHITSSTQRHCNIIIYTLVVYTPCLPACPPAPTFFFFFGLSLSLYTLPSVFRSFSLSAHGKTPHCPLLPFSMPRRRILNAFYFHFRCNRSDKYPKSRKQQKKLINSNRIYIYIMTMVSLCSF